MRILTSADFEGVLSVDVETTGLKHSDELISIAITDETLKSHFFQKCDLNAAMELLASNKPKVFHNAPFDLDVLTRNGFVVNGTIHDTLVMIHILNEYEPIKKLKPLAAKYLKDSNEEAARYDAWTKKHGFYNVPLEILEPYNVSDTVKTLKLLYLMRKDIIKDFIALYSMEIELIPAIVSMRQNGLLLDTEYCYTTVQKLFFEMESLNKDIQEECFKRFDKSYNLASPKQKQDLLFNKLKLDPLDYNKKTNTPKADKMAFAEYSSVDPLVAKIAKYLKLTKLSDFYDNQLLTFQEDEIVYPNWNTTGTVTGRPSCSQPNLLNMPKNPKDEEFKEFTLRRAFIARPGKTNIYLDYNQMELFGLAWLGNEPKMKDALSNGKDLHQLTTNEMHADDRFIGKTFNFAIPYGLGVEGGVKYLMDFDRKAERAGEKRMLPKDAKIDDYHRLSEQLVNSWYAAYPGVKKLFESTKEDLRTKGYVQSPLGRRFRTPIYEAYIVVNALIQGTCADVAKRAMIAIHNHINEYEPHCKLLLQIYDEFIIEVPTRDAVRVRDLVQAFKMVIEGSNPTDISFTVDAKTSITNWAEKK